MSYWLAAQTREPYRLLSEAEWEYALPRRRDDPLLVWATKIDARKGELL